MNALIFGATGQDGYYLTTLLTREGVSVLGVARHGADVKLDISDIEGVRALLRDNRPDFIFNLAATSSAAHSHLWTNHRTIATGTLALLDAVERESPYSRVLLVGSGLQFVNNGAPLNEDSPLDHSSPYTIARNSSLFAARYFRTRGMNIKFAFLFNHDSPLRSNAHLNMRIAEAAVAAAHGATDTLVLGDLDAEKEFGFAGDVAAALWLLANRDECAECVIGTGKPHSVRDWLSLCFNHVGIDWGPHVASDPEFNKPYHRLVSDPARIRNLGWRPTSDIFELSTMLMQSAIDRFARPKNNTFRPEELEARPLSANFEHCNSLPNG